MCEFRLASSLGLLNQVRPWYVPEPAQIWLKGVYAFLGPCLIDLFCSLERCAGTVSLTPLTWGDRAFY